MTGFVSRDETLKFFSQVLTKLADTFILLLQVDCQGDEAPPRVDLLLFVSELERELKLLLCAILCPDNYDQNALQFVEKHGCKIILQGCSALIELLYRQLLLCANKERPNTPPWREICTWLGNYRIHLLSLEHTLKDTQFANWPSFFRDFEDDESNARQQLDDFCRRHGQVVTRTAPAEPEQPNNTGAEATAQEPTADQPTPVSATQPSGVAVDLYTEGLKEGQKSERKRLLDVLDSIGLLGHSPTKRAAWLLRAIRKGSTECVQLLIDKGANVNGDATIHGPRKDLPLATAAGSGCKEIIEVLLGNRARIHERNASGNSAILSAAAAGNVDGIEILLEHEANIEDTRASEPEQGYTPIMLAVSRGHATTVKFLDQKKANTRIRSAANESLLHLAVQKDRMDIIKYLLHENIGVDDDDKDGNTALHLACQKGMKQIAETLIEKRKLLLRVSNKMVETPLHLAVREKKEPVIELLLQNGAPVNAATGARETPLHYAVKAAALNAAKLLIQEGANLNPKDKRGRTPLHLAIDSKSLQIVRLLLESGASPDAEDKYNRTPLHYAVLSQSQHTALIDLILSKQPNLDASDKDGKTPLHHAVTIGKPTILEKLLAAGAKTDIANKNGLTALDRVMKMSDEEEANSLLLLHEFLQNHHRGHAFTETSPILSIAASKGKLAHVKKIIEKDLGLINRVPEKGEMYGPALHEAVKTGQQEVVKALCNRRETNKDLPDRSGNAPLHQAIISGDATMVSLLVGLGANVELPNSENGFRPLHLAAQRQELQIVRALIAAGAKAMERIHGDTCIKCRDLSWRSHKRIEGMNARCPLQNLPPNQRKQVFSQIDDLLHTAIKSEARRR